MNNIYNIIKFSKKASCQPQKTSKPINQMLDWETPTATATFGVFLIPGGCTWSISKRLGKKATDCTGKMCWIFFSIYGRSLKPKLGGG